MSQGEGTEGEVLQNVEGDDCKARVIRHVGRGDLFKLDFDWGDRQAPNAVLSQLTLDDLEAIGLACLGAAGYVFPGDDGWDDEEEEAEAEPEDGGEEE